VAEFLVDPEEVSYIAIDPGETCGVAYFGHSGKVVWLEQVPMSQLLPTLLQYPNLETIICEDYRVFPHKAKDHILSDLKTVRAIGRIEAVAHIHDIKLIMQPSHLMKSGYAYLGKKKSHTKTRHQEDALAHGMYYLINAGIVSASTLL
jgi:hypothetical protein